MPPVTLSAEPPLDASSSARGAAPLDSRAIGPELVARLLRQTDRTEALGELSDYARRLTNGLFAVYLARGEHDRLFAAAQALAYEGRSLPPDLLQRLGRWGDLACESGQARIDLLPGDLTLISVPIERREALCVALLLNGARVEPFLLAVQLLAMLTPFVDRHLAQRETAWEAEATAAILDLALRLALARDLKSGCRMLVEQLPQCLPGQRVALGLLNSATGRCRLMALTGLQDFDPRTELPRAVESVLQQAAGHASTLTFPSEAPIEALVRLAEVSKCPGLLAAPLRTPEGRTIGAWLFLADGSITTDPAQQPFIAAASEAVAAGLAGLQQRRWRPWQGPSQGRRWLKPALLLLALTVATAMGIPFDYQITCECQLQPATRRFVAAPFAGVLEKSLAAPGDLVVRDQVLGLMDGKEIRWELASVTAEQQRASKAHHVNLAAGKVAAAQIDRLEMERLAQKRQLLEHRSANLQIKSPIDGILLSGDLKRSEGVPLTVGQRLYEVAPLEQMIVELFIPDEEVSLVEPGQTVSVRLDAVAGELRRADWTAYTPAASCGTTRTCSSARWPCLTKRRCCVPA